MNFGLSTQVFLPHRLTTAHLDALAAAGVQTIELTAARHHLDYTDRAQLREIAAWFRSNAPRPTLHAPVSNEPYFSRHAAPNLDLVSRDKTRRIDAMEEIKRALETAESIPVGACVLHLGLPEDEWSDYTLEHALTAVEHLKAFAAPLGVQLLLENLPNKVATPEHLLAILKIGHFDQCGVCFDVGHAHLATGGVDAPYALLQPRIGLVHLSDNNGVADEHLWPASGTERPAWALRGTLDWAHLYDLLAGVGQPCILQPADRTLPPQPWTGAANDSPVAQLGREVLAHAQRLVTKETR